MSKNSPDVTAKQKALMLGAIEANYGNITKAAKMIKITPQTHYRWLKEDREYAEKSEDLRDISYRMVKDKLLELSLQMAEKGNAMVLNQMLRIYFKNTPEEMRMSRRMNDVPLRVGVKWVSTPQDPRREGYVKPTEERRGGG